MTHVYIIIENCKRNGHIIIGATYTESEADFLCNLEPGRSYMMIPFFATGHIISVVTTEKI